MPTASVTVRGGSITHTHTHLQLGPVDLDTRYFALPDNFQVFAHSELVLISHFGTVSYNTVIFIL